MHFPMVPHAKIDGRSPLVLGRHSAEGFAALSSPGHRGKSPAKLYGGASNPRVSPDVELTQKYWPLAQASPFFLAHSIAGDTIVIFFSWPGTLSAISRHTSIHLASNTRLPLLVCHLGSMHPMMLAAIP